MRAMNLLPVEERYAFVFTASPPEAKRLLAADDAQFLAELQSHFGDRAGRFVSVSGRASFPLRLRAVIFLTSRQRSSNHQQTVDIPASWPLDPEAAADRTDGPSQAPVCRLRVRSGGLDSC